MSFVAGAAGKPVSMATNSCLISGPSHFTDYQTCVSIPYDPMKFRFSCITMSSKLLPSAVSLKKKQRFFSVAVIASQQEENNPVILAEEEEPEGESDPEGEESDEGSEDGYAEPPEGAKLYVGNLPFDVDSEKLAQLFEKAGVVEISEVIYNRETDRSRGFGFVTMSTEEEADKAVDIFNRYDLGGRLLTVNKAAPKGSRVVEPPPRVYNPGYRIYVGNLPWSADDARLEEIFSEHGKVISARVVSDRETGRSRGFGFVVMSSEAEMNDAIASLDGQSLDGRPIRVNVAEERQRRSF